MLDSRVRNIFSKLTYKELCIDRDSDQVLQLSDPGPETIGLQTTTNFISAPPKAVEIIGNHSVIIFIEDMQRIESFLKQNRGILNQEEPHWLERFNYRFLMASDIEKFEPDSGYLYNLLKQEKDKNFIIYRTFQKPLGVTNYDFAVKKINQRLQKYY